MVIKKNSKQRILLINAPNSPFVLVVPRILLTGNKNSH